MKIMRISNPYIEYIRLFLAKNPSLSGISYQEQRKTLEMDAFAGPDLWAFYLPQHGFEVMEVAANIELLQRRWAEENHVPLTDDNWYYQTLHAQIEAFKPELLFIQDAVTLPVSRVEELREKFTFIKKILVWCGAPHSDLAVFRAYDGILSCVPELVDGFVSDGHKAFHINHSFDSRILDRLEKREIKYPLSFVGQIVRKSGFHLEREKLLQRLASEVGITIFSPSANIKMKAMGKFLAKKIGHVVRPVIPQALAQGKMSKAFPEENPVAPVNVRLKKYMRPPVFGMEMYQTLLDSAVTWNSHIDASVRSASNMRMFEATGVGTCLLTDWKENLSSLFDDSEVVAYSSAEDCIEKAQWLMENPKRCEEIGNAAKRRVMKEHSFAIRSQELSHILKSKFF